MIVELGPGTRPHQFADVGIDLHHPINREPWNATNTPWPHLEPDSVDVVYSSHFLEHVSRDDGGLIRVMNEAWRVLRSGGAFIAVMPLVGYTDPNNGLPKHDQVGWQPWADPTHVTFWWLPEAFMYFCDGPFKPNADYGIKVWAPLGGYMEPDAADLAIFDIRSKGSSFWSVKNGWEGIVRIYKP